MSNSDLTVLIHSCHKFSDLWPAHTKLLSQNWPDRKIRTIILTDDAEECYYDSIEIISAGHGKEMTERIRHVLPLINTKYLLVTLDDYFPIYPISSDKIFRLVDIMEKEQLDYIRLFPHPKCPEVKTKYEGIGIISLDGDYRVNLYAGLWTKDFIAATLGDKVLNAWDFEVSLTANARKANGKCAVSHGNEFPILDVVRKGKILPNAYKYLKKHNLYHGNREMMPYKAVYKLNIKTFWARLFSKLPFPVYKAIKRICVKFGMKSFSANK